MIFIINTKLMSVFYFISIFIYCTGLFINFRCFHHYSPSMRIPYNTTIGKINNLINITHESICSFSFHFVLFYFILFCFILFYFVSFYSILFHFILFCFILFYFVSFYVILFQFILFCFMFFHFISYLS